MQNKVKNFDRFVAIDWSGAKSPVRTHAISLAYCLRGSEAPSFIRGPLSRYDVVSWIEASLTSSERTLIGIDCNFGYAEAIGLDQFGKNYTHKDIWRAVERSSEDLPNYSAEGFWKDSEYSKYFWSSGKRPALFDDTIRRVTEQICKDQGLGQPENPFKLIGPKQVGKGGLSGMRMAYDLKKKFKSKICFWPFEKETPQTQIVITEIYPRIFLKMAGLSNKKVRSIDELNPALAFFKSESIETSSTITDHIADAITSAAGLRYLCGNGSSLPEYISNPDGLTKRVAEREGWIFGISKILNQ